MFVLCMVWESRNDFLIITDLPVEYAWIWKDTLFGSGWSVPWTIWSGEEPSWHKHSDKFAKIGEKIMLEAPKQLARFYLEIA